MVDTAFDEGIEKGIEKGIEIGKKQGWDEGALQKAREIAVRLKAQGVASDQISSITGLTLAEIAQLV